jgi:hypothetical protein
MRSRRSCPDSTADLGTFKGVGGPERARLWVFGALTAVTVSLEKEVVDAVEGSDCGEGSCLLKVYE